ncbi:MAG: hypothetical protein ABEH88_11720 [Halobacteriales archaeon]
MAINAVLVDPPRPGLVLSDLVATTPLSEDEAATLYAAMAKDVLRAAERSGAELLVNYRSEETLSEGHASDAGTGAEAEVRALAADALSEPDAARYEPQVGSTHAARVGNTATHLLETESADSVSILDPRAPTVARTDLDGAAMSLRSNETVLGPATAGRVYYYGMTAPIDFEGAYGPPAMSTITRRAVEAGHDVSFVDMHPVVATRTDLATLLVVIESRVAANTPVPEATTEALYNLDLRVDTAGRRPTIERT